MTPLPGEGLKQLGFTPTQLAIIYLVEKIDGGDFEAQENSLSSTYNFNLHKHHRHITLTGHIFRVAAFLCNQKVYYAWPEDVRDAIEASAIEATHEQRRLAIAEDEAVLSRLNPTENEVVNLSAAERANFVEAARPLIDSYRVKLGPELFDALL
jgi:TRAP-type C4-dicarboxylate transport system substrate-binding protein